MTAHSPSRYEVVKGHHCLRGPEEMKRCCGLYIQSQAAMSAPLLAHLEMPPLQGLGLAHA